MRLEEALPALRAGGTICLDEDEISSDLIGEKLTFKQLLSEGWSVVLPERAPGVADANARGPETAERPVPGHGGFVLDMKTRTTIHAFDDKLRKDRTFLDSLDGPEIVNVDGRWLYADPAMPEAATK